MNERTRSLLIGLAFGALVGAVFGWIVGDAEEEATRSPNQPVGLSAMTTGDFVKIGISVLALVRELNVMLQRR